MQNYKFLNNINFPSDLRKLSEHDLQNVSDEVREEMISAVSETGGHLGAGLGVVELTVALHYVFDTPNDKLIWDVGHQSYPHKILTGRKNKIRSLRQGNGLSGFTKRSESEYDPFGAAHSSTSISSALGIAEANKLANKSSNVIAVKKTGKDQKKGKATLISLLGHMNAIKYCDRIILKINKNLKKYGSNSKNIKETLNYILHRQK